MPCAPLRLLANDRNLVRDAVLVASSVEPVDDQVLPVPVARGGTAEVRLTGSYTGDEEATYDIEIVDTALTVPLVSAVVTAGKGSSKLVDVAAIGLDAQEIVVELVDAGKPATYAAVAFEGVTLQARSVGAGGNDLRVSIDQTGLTFSDTDFALLVDLAVGEGAPTSGLEGAGFDWDTAALGADGLIPATAKRVAFGDDRSTVYLAYKRYADNRWTYHFVPAIRRAIPKGTPVLFATGGREVTITDGITPEIYTGIATVYDLLSQVRAGSSLVTVEGVVANDRSPDGQAAQELLARTDAHVEPSTGTGSAYAALGFADTFANATARTELVIATCYAVTGKDHPLARLGAERWRVSSSLGGEFAIDAVTGAPYLDPSGESRFGFTIPRRLPPGYGAQRGRFAQVGPPQYVARASDDPEPPPICVGALTLGTEASDQTITLTWAKRPSGNCDCSDLPFPRLGGDCLGTFSEGGDDMSYSNANRLRLVGLYQWYAELARANSQYHETTVGQVNALQDPALNVDGTAVDAWGSATTNVPVESIRDVVDKFAAIIDELEALPEGDSPDLRGAGETDWDTAVAEFQADLADIASGDVIYSIPSERYIARMRQTLMTAGVSPLGKSDASILDSGDGCWRDWGDSYYFTVDGSLAGGYAPLFVNRPYYSSRLASETGKYFSTHEFALQVNVADSCVANLREGDKVVLAIGDASWAATYQVGDAITLPVISAADLYLAGGRDDDSEQTWSVTGGVDGPFPAWMFTPGASGTAYASDSTPSLSWDIEAGGIANAKGDSFRFKIEGGHFRWRKDGGAWSADIDIPTAPVLIDDGLSAAFIPGAAPSYVDGDVHSFVALQPWAVSNVQAPRPEAWRWDAETGGAVLDLDFGSAQPMDAVAIAMHTIPTGATITLAGGASAPTDWTESVTWRSGVIVQILTQDRSARYVRLTITGGDGGQIGWLWIGDSLRTELSADVQLRGAFRIERGSGPLYQGGATLGKARSASIDWSEAALSEDDAQSLVALFEYVKGNGDEPLIVLPHVNRPQDALLGRIIEDELQFTELSGQQRNDTTARRYAASLSIAGVWQQ